MLPPMATKPHFTHALLQKPSSENYISYFKAVKKAGLESVYIVMTSS